MDRLHARYPFLEAARAAVQEAGVELPDLVQERGAPVDRALERVERGLIEGTAAPEGRWPARAELLSYPIARVLVSLLDMPGAVEKYARAEATLARERFGEDFHQDIRSGRDERLDQDQLLVDLGLDDVVTLSPTASMWANAERQDSRAAESTPGSELPGSAEEASETDVGTEQLQEIDGPQSPEGGHQRQRSEGESEQYFVDVTTYLMLSADLDGEDWALVARQLDAGHVPVSQEELYTLLREAIRRRIADGLPLDVPEDVAVALDTEVATLREALAEIELSTDIDTVVPGMFPPCMQALLSQARSEGLVTLPDHSRFALLTFLIGSGLDADGVMELCSVSTPAAATAVREQVARLRDDTGQFAPPGCEAMVAYGDCVNKDELCATIAHPLEYYEKRLQGAPKDRVVDWRET